LDLGLTTRLASASVVALLAVITSSQRQRPIKSLSLFYYRTAVVKPYKT